MYTFEPKPDERYYTIKTGGVFKPDECRKFIQNVFDFSREIGFRRYGSIHDMRELAEMPEETRLILQEGMALSLATGFTAVGRVFQDINDEVMSSMRKANTKAGFVANYFLNTVEARKYVKSEIARYPDEPVLTMDEAVELLNSRFKSLKIKI